MKGSGKKNEDIRTRTIRRKRERERTVCIFV